MPTLQKIRRGYGSVTSASSNHFQKTLYSLATQGKGHGGPPVMELSFLVGGSQVPVNSGNGG